jgi:hypothetical protein
LYPEREGPKKEEGLKLNGTHQLLAYADDVTILGEKNNIQKNTVALLDADKEVGPDLVTCIILKRLQWAGYVQRMEGTRIPKKAFKPESEGVRSVGKPRKRREDVVQQDADSFLRCRNWKLAANDRTLWRQNIVEAKVFGCSAIRWMEGGWFGSESREN